MGFFSKSKEVLKNEGETFLGTRQVSNTKGIFTSLIQKVKPKKITYAELSKDKDFEGYQNLMGHYSKQELSNLYFFFLFQSYLGMLLFFISIFIALTSHGFALFPILSFSFLFLILWIKGSYGCFYLNHKHLGGLLLLLKSPLEYLPNPSFVEGE